MALTAAERETTINWSDADGGIARIDTSQRRIMRKLSRHPRAQLIERRTDDDGNVTSETWEIPVECVSIRRGTKRRLSDADREAARQRMKAIRRTHVAIGT